MDVYPCPCKHGLIKLMLDEPMHLHQNSQPKEKSNGLSVSLSAVTLLTIYNYVPPWKNPGH